MIADDFHKQSENVEWTKQRVFDTVWNGLQSQGFMRSTNNNGQCMYRGSNGHRCAAGWLIPDEVMCPNLESNSWDGIYDTHGLEFLLPFRGMIGDLQAIHDESYDSEGCDTPYMMKRKLREYARLHDLSIPGETA